MDYKNISLTRESSVALVTLMRPEHLNSFNEALIEELGCAFDGLATDEQIRAVIITGSGRAFSAGADLGDLGIDNTPVDNIERGRVCGQKLRLKLNPIVAQIESMPKPVICAVNGLAAGGGVGLALCCDIVIAAESAKFLQVFTPSLGLIPDMGCTWFVPRLIGHARARGSMMLGHPITALEAVEWGLIWKCVSDDTLSAEVMAIASSIAEGPSQGFKFLKKALAQSSTNTLAQQLELEGDHQGILNTTEDFAEAIAAFREKRVAIFKGK